MNYFWLTVLIFFFGCGIIAPVFKFFVRRYFVCITVLLLSLILNVYFITSVYNWYGIWAITAIGLSVIGSLVVIFRFITPKSYNIPYKYIATDATYALMASFLPLLVLLAWNHWIKVARIGKPEWISLLVVNFLGMLSFGCDFNELIAKVVQKLDDITYANYDGIVFSLLPKRLQEKKDDDDEKKERISLIKFIIEKKISEKTFVLFSLGTSDYIFRCTFWDDFVQGLSKTIYGEKRIPEQNLRNFVKDKMTIPDDLLDELISHTDVDIRKYEFSDGDFYVSDQLRDNIKICNTCGLAELKESSMPIQSGEFFCCELCEETDRICNKFLEETSGRPLSDFASMAAAMGIATSGNAYYWGRNLKMVSHNSRGPHGFAAEEANSDIDRLLLRDAKIIGDDNAKNGADRLVDNVLIQSKYCQTARDSVNSGFGNDGIYKYMDANNKPMQLEVPNDQYSKALSIMKEKIAEGKVPGITNPDDANKIIRKGHITYQQAVAITKAGTIESLLFDARRGIVVGLAAGGISFTIATAIAYWHTKDIETAIRSSVILALKSGGLAALSFIGTQQLQRLPQVNAFLDKAININWGGHGKFAKRIGDGLYKMGGGTGNFNKKVNATVKSAVVMAGVTFAITSSFEMIKFARGRISGWQCWKNIVQGAGGITGGTLGALIGGALLSPIPVIGTITGSFLGGAIGGAIGAKGAKAVMDKYGDDDSVVVVRLITHQIEFLTNKYCINQEEFKIISENIQNSLNLGNALIEDIFSKHQYMRQYITSLIQPIFVKIIASRNRLPQNSFNTKNLINVLDA